MKTLLLSLLAISPEWHVVASRVVGGPYHQHWGKVDDAALSLTRGQDVWVERFDPLSLQQTTPSRILNELWTSGVQDEGEVLVLANGNVVAATSDRSSHWTDYMDVRARVWSPNMIPLGWDFSVSTATTTAWRPQLCRGPGNTWFCMYTVEWSEEAVFRWFAADGTPLGPERLMHVLSGGRQNSPDGSLVGGKLGWAYMEAAPNPDIVFGGSTTGGSILRSTHLYLFGAQGELKMDSSGSRFAIAWHTDQQSVWSLARGGAPRLVAPGRDVELALRSAGGMIVWDDGSSVGYQMLDDRGRLDGAPGALLSGLVPFPSTLGAELSRRQPDVWLSPDLSYGTLSLTIWNGSDDDVLLCRIEPVP